MARFPDRDRDRDLPECVMEECHRDAVTHRGVGGKTYPLCRRHV